MDFITFLQQSRTPDFWERTSRVGFTSTTYPVLFFSDFFTYIHDVVTTRYTGITHLDIHTHTFGDSIASLETSFLGMRSVYWLKNISELSAASKQQWFAYVRAYQGPHCVLFFVDDADTQTDEYVVLPATVDKQLFTQLVTFFTGTSTLARVQPVIQMLYTRHTTLPFDTACSMIRYIVLMGNQYQTFFDSWLDTFIVPETSLFTLSQHFFARSPQKFFATWKGIAWQYGEQFWIAFWSEQLWRAYHVVECLQQSRFVEAKSLSYRLPFSLMQQDWKKLSLAELQQSHAFLYGIDTALKNGGNAGSLDLFYSKFFLQQFVD